MSQTGIPFLFMRGGTSRGPYFNARDLPEDRHVLTEVLLAAVGSGHPLNIDGIGGGAAVTTKVAMLSKSDSDWADIDYFFVRIQELWLATGGVFGFNHKSRQSAMSSCQAGRQSGWTCSDYDHVPVRQAVEIQIF